jgi:hypothetical protein
MAGKELTPEQHERKLTYDREYHKRTRERQNQNRKKRDTHRAVRGATMTEEDAARLAPDSPLLLDFLRNQLRAENEKKALRILSRVRKKQLQAGVDEGLAAKTKDEVLAMKPLLHEQSIQAAARRAVLKAEEVAEREARRGKDGVLRKKPKRAKAK